MTTNTKHEPVFLKACRGEPTPYTPVWLMRQAGRYMAEYRELRSRVGFLELCKSPELATQVTVEAADKIGADAAIIFSDILLVLEPMGMNLEYSKGDGPVLHNPVRESSDVDRLQSVDVKEQLPFVLEALRQTRKALPESRPLIGFSGAPFTLAAYMIEGGSSRNFEKVKTFMYRDAGAWAALMQKLSRAVTDLLTAQIEAGAQVVQLFDSWVGCLSPSDYREYVLPHVKRVFEGLPQGVPTIHFGVGTGTMLEEIREAGGDVIGIDHHQDLDVAWGRIPGAAVQGNLDPVALLAGRDVALIRAGKVLERAGGKQGYIFNLGHGVLPPTDVETVKAVIDFVHEQTVT